MTGSQGSTVVSSVGGQSAANVASATSTVNGATSLDLDDSDDLTTTDIGTGLGDLITLSAASTLPALDGSNLTNLTGANVSGTVANATNATNATNAGTATNFSGSLSGDVTGSQGSTVVSSVGGQSAANVASATSTVNGATSLDLDDSDDITTSNIGSLSANINTSGTLDAGATTVSNLTVSDLAGGTTGGTLSIDGSGTLSLSSDKRLKENIKLLSNTVQKLDELGGYNYNYKADEKKKTQIGVIAQELRKVFPELVNEDSRGFLMVNYQGLIPVLIQALKEQQATINQLNERVASQESKLSAIQKDNEEMKSDLDFIKKMLKGNSNTSNAEDE